MHKTDISFGLINDFQRGTEAITMKFLTTGIALCLIGIAVADVESDFAKEEIVPDVLDKAPTELLQVIYGDKMVRLGNEMTPTEVKNIPEIHYNHEEIAFYTLAMIDPDAPSRAEPTLREWCHWLVVNIPGEDVSKGQTLSEYIGSGPPKDTGLHRYVILIYKQPGKLMFYEPYLTNRNTKGRGRFSIKKFAVKYNLGVPVAGNMFQAQFDDYVPLLYKQLGA